MVLAETVKIAQRTLPEHWRTAVFRADHGACLTQLGRYVDAEPQLLGAFGALEDAFGAKDFRTQEVIKYLIDFYETSSQPDKGARYRPMLNARGR